MIATKRKPLPRTLWGLLNIACKDAQRTELNPLYELAMGEWHNPDGGKCRVCMAGAVMACTLSTNSRRFVVPANFGDQRSRLVAIDSMRRGSFEGAYRLLHGLTLLGDLESGEPDPADIPIEARRVLRRVSKMVAAEFCTQQGRAPWFVYAQAVEILKEAGL